MAVVLDLLKNDPRPAAPVRLRHPEKAHRPDQPVQARKPDWIRVKAPGSPAYAETRAIVREHGLVTVCEEAGCPNIGECWEKRHATFMIMGDTCTRACAFCNVRTGLPGALGQPGVGFLMAIVIGAIAGWLAEKFTSSDMGLFSNIIMGILGGLLGNFLAAKLDIAVFGFWRNLLSATIGAIIIITIYRAIRGRSMRY